MKRLAWLAALLLVVLVNAIVLAGVAWNRSGVPEATVQLTERELALPYWFARSEENTGMALRLNLHADSYAPDWLDANKLRELGFSVAETISDAVDSDERLKRPLPRHAWVALEFDGPAWQGLLADEERRLAELRLEVEAGKATGKQVKEREEALTRMRQSGSRLVAVDADNEAAVLRARYPDSTRYLIMGAEVRMWVGRAQSSEDEAGPLSVQGYLRLLVDRIHVPLQHRTVLQSVSGEDLQDDRARDEDRSPRYVVRLQYGKRYEPWVEDIAALRSQ